MAAKGITIKRSESGRIKQIVINATAPTELVEDLVDTIIYESQKDEPTVPWEQVKQKAQKIHSKKNVQNRAI